MKKKLPEVKELSKCKKEEANEKKRQRKVK